MNEILILIVVWLFGGACGWYLKGPLKRRLRVIDVKMGTVMGQFELLRVEQ